MTSHTPLPEPVYPDILPAASVLKRLRRPHVVPVLPQLPDGIRTEDFIRPYRRASRDDLQLRRLQDAALVRLREVLGVKRIRAARFCLIDTGPHKWIVDRTSFTRISASPIRKALVQLGRYPQHSDTWNRIFRNLARIVEAPPHVVIASTHRRGLIDWTEVPHDVWTADYGPVRPYPHGRQRPAAAPEDR